MDGQAAVRVEPFVFATAQYESGDWDSAPMVPANVIDAIARYTNLPVRPQGISVPLSSEVVYGYPLLYLTGHLPVRFSNKEADVLRQYLRRGGMLFIDERAEPGRKDGVRYSGYARHEIMLHLQHRFRHRGQVIRALYGGEHSTGPVYLDDLDGPAAAANRREGAIDQRIHIDAAHGVRGGSTRSAAHSRAERRT